MAEARAPYSYRYDPAIPPFPDDKPVFIFDGVCVLCSGGAHWLMRHDKRGLFRFAPAQSPLGQALYRHYGVAMDETYLLLVDGSVYGKSSGYLEMLGILGGWWRGLNLLRVIPRALRDRAYDVVARNRYRWFGKTDYCSLIPPELKAKLLS
jgi:predicted DCC family thiol-disulfide oxidoreductase YuxK